MSKFGIVIDAQVIAALFATNVTDSQEFVPGELLVWLTCSLLLSLALVYMNFSVSPKAPKGTSFWRLCSAVLLFMAVYAVFDRIYTIPPSHWFLPFNPSVSEAMVGEKEVRKLGKLIWLGDSLGKTRKRRTGKGRIEYRTKNRDTGDRLVVYAGKADFSIISEGTLRRYDRFGQHLLTRLTTRRLIRGFTPAGFLPFNYLGALGEFVVSRYAMVNAAGALKDISLLPSSLNEKTSKQLAVIVVVGESARADHFGLNGYQRPTTPIMEKTPSLLNFADAHSCSASTTVAIPCMLTRMTMSDLPGEYSSSNRKTYLYQQIATEKSFISVFRKHGFDTAWFSLNYLLGRKNAPISMLLNEAETVVFRNETEAGYAEALDESLLGKLDRYLEAHDDRLMLALHTRGSHWNYSQRYPPAFKHFTPECAERAPYQCGSKQLVNSYDNSILYTDWFISEVIKRVENRNAIIFYTSDHGESLGEDGIYTHSVMSRREQRHIPLIIWASETYRGLNGDLFDTLATRRKNPVSHDNMFHTILGCSGITGDVIDKELDLCSPPG